MFKILTHGVFQGLLWIAAFHLCSPLHSIEIRSQFGSEKLGYGEFNIDKDGELVLMRHIIKPGSVVFDVGASQGNWSLIALNVQPSILLYAFEPIPPIFDMLKRATNPHHSAEVYNCALSDELGTANFTYYSSSMGASELSGFYDRVELRSLLPRSELISVSLETLDHFCSVHAVKKIDFLKIDTEGAEWKVLCGAESLLKNHQIRALQFEYGGTYLDAKTTLQQVMELLTRNNYVVFRIIPTGLVHISEWNAQLENFTYSNYFAVCLEDMPGYPLVKFTAP